MRRLRIEIERDGVRLFLNHDGDFPFKLTEVFLCPPYSFSAAVQRVLEVMGHV